MQILFCHIGWMENYKGITAHDKIEGGGSYVKEEGRGHEVCNFAPFRTEIYGYVQSVGEQINIDRLGAEKDDEYIENITVVWTATKPKVGTVVVGWYKDATIYRDYKYFKKIPSLQKENNIDCYRVKGSSDNFKLLPIDERVIQILRGKGGMGRSNVWYADSEEAASFVKQVSKYISGKRLKPSARKNKPDIEHNSRVEKSAVKCVSEYYQYLGYEIKSVEKDNVGWDLEASNKRDKLLIEVKGLSGDKISVGLTPNEYKALSNRKDSYRLCIVKSALTNPTLYILRYSKEACDWVVENESSYDISVSEILSATIEIRI